jgi:plasmid stabilization system protein ParE
VTLFIQESAEADILRQVERYAEQGLPHIARRFHASILAAIDALVAMPEAGPPRPTANAALIGLRAWPVKGFDAFWIYYLAGPERLTVVRGLHGKRDIGTILEEQDLQTP